MKAISRLCSFMLLLLLAACSDGAGSEQTKHEAAITNTAPKTDSLPAKPVKPEPLEEVKETAFDYDSLKEDVLIRLNEEPRLHSPIRTVVSAKPQGYTLFFREPMNRSSVEETLQKRAKEALQSDTRFTPITFAFRWVNDRQLHLLVTAPPMEKQDEGSRSYQLDLQGAATKKGKILVDPPSFMATLYTPAQLWRISLDGKVREPLTSFEQPYYSMRFLDPDNRYLLLSRFQQYCECDADHERIYAVYDTKEKIHTFYPVELETNYMGSGEFVADKRGFFYKKPSAKIAVPESNQAVSIHLDEFVQGASFSKDLTNLFMAIGQKNQTENFDLLIKNLDTGQEQRLSKALRGKPETNQISAGFVPVIFTDDGKYVSVTLEGEMSSVKKYYRYSWQTGALSSWNPPFADYMVFGLDDSSDGVYQFYPHTGVYKGTTKIKDLLSEGEWVTGTHQLIYSIFANRPADTGTYKEFMLYDVDKNTTKTIATDLSPSSEILGTTSDGKWIYVRANENLTKSNR